MELPCGGLGSPPPDDFPAHGVPRTNGAHIYHNNLYDSKGEIEMDFTKLIDNEFFLEIQLGRCLKKWERKKISDTAKQLNRVPTVRE